MENVLILLLPLFGFSIWAFWSKHPVAFELCFGLSLVIGLQWYNLFKTSDALAVSLALQIYAFICSGFALSCMFAMPREKED